MSIWECCELLNDVVESDLDSDEPQIEHLLRISEAIRKGYPIKIDYTRLPSVHGIFQLLFSSFYYI